MKANRSRDGFTLIELVVSLAITAVIAAFIFSFSSSLSKIWKSSQTDVDVNLDANIALDRIAMDLESAIFQERGVPMFALSAIAATAPQTDEEDKSLSDRWVNPKVQGAGRLSTLHFSVADHHYGWAGLWMRFFSSQPSFNAVGYQIIRRPAYTNSTVSRYLLHRTVVRQDHTMLAGYDITSSNYSGKTASDVDAANIASPRVSLVLLENVVDFGVRLYVYEAGFAETADTPKGLRLIFPSSNDKDLDDTERWFKGESRGGATATRYPDVVEVYLRVISDEGAELLRRSEDVEAGASYAVIVAEHAKVYRRLIRIPGSDT